ncbi:DUF397 domain-containing protein [Nocardia sp. R7R-8]|uniref:DUF397 domain-containing protein n=1 Tax=Nocardia sp. R7R-8 TaxID=3459304 RepID=UPI00403E0BAE
MTSQDRLMWRTSSYSGTNGGQCVEVAFSGHLALIRDSKYLRDPANNLVLQPVISVPIDQWASFLDLARGLRVAQTPEMPILDHLPDGAVTLTKGDHILMFTAAEWAAFTAGVRDGEFAAA